MQGQFLAQVLVTSMAKQRANVTDRASDASAVCSNGLTYSPLSLAYKVEEKGQWKFEVKTEK